MKTCIVVIGNIGSGKSRVCGDLERTLRQTQSDKKWVRLCMDDCRVEALRCLPNSNAFYREAWAERLFLAGFIGAENIVYESTGCSGLYRRVRVMLRREEYKIITIKLSTPVDVCWVRYHARLREPGLRVNAPWSKKEGLRKRMNELDDALRMVHADLIFKDWVEGDVERVMGLL